MNYENISKAVEYYESRGYVYIQDAPWTVSRTAYYATKPEGATDVVFRESPTKEAGRNYFVASGEQSFLQMLLDGQPLKQAICVTPCFRVEHRDDWHLPYFVKAELINGQDVDAAHLMYMIHQAAGFFEKFCSIRIVEGPNGSYDIVEKGSRRELGSYGIRTLTVDGKNFRWIYGTACAEPRLTTVLSRRNPFVR